MIQKILPKAAFAACLSGALLGASAAKAGFSAEYVFGDSLSDVGNVYLATGGVEPAGPYVGGQFSNGPVWVQDLAARLGLPALTPSLAGGNDYAFGGATTGSTYTNSSAVPNLTQQLDTFFLSHASAPSTALYTFSIGANDLFAILDGATGGLTALQAAAAAAQVVASEAGDLAAAGAKDLALFDVPDLGLTPGITALGPTASAAASFLSAYFDQQVLLDLAPVEAAGLTVFDLNTFALIDEAVKDPSKFGFSNVTDPCWTGGFTGSATGGSLCSSTLPRDDVHGRLPFLGRRSSDRGRAISSFGGTRRSAPWGSPCRSPRPGRCCCLASQAWALPDTVAPRWLARLREGFSLATRSRSGCIDPTGRRYPKLTCGPFARQRHEPGHVDLLRPHRRLEPGGGDQRGKVEPTRGGEALERLAQHLAPLAERSLGQRRKRRRVARRRRGARDELDHAGRDLGRRREGGGRRRRTGCALLSAIPPAPRGARSRRAGRESATMRRATSRWNIRIRRS